jgi:LytS/YehU family sensor histidine kinase
MELAPHFLFNALQSISAQIHTNPDGANDTLVRVSDMLRHAIETSRVQEVALRDELATLRLYTEIAEVRFGDRLDLRWDVAPETLDAAVPHMLLQPLVENAIKHGLEVRSTSGRIEVSAARVGDTLRLAIRDDGPGVRRASPRRGSGVGLANTRARLHELYGARHTFTLGGGAQGGTEVVITLPFVRAAEGITAQPRPQSDAPDYLPSATRATSSTRSAVL